LIEEDSNKSDVAIIEGIKREKNVDEEPRNRTRKKAQYPQQNVMEASETGEGKKKQACIANLFASAAITCCSGVQ